MEILYFVVVTIGLLIWAAILHAIIFSAARTKEKINYQRLQTKILMDIALKLGVEETDIMKHFTSENSYQKFIDRKSYLE